MSSTITVTSALPEPSTITVSEWFRGCVLWPDSAQEPCCTQVNSTAMMVNGTFGCPYTSVFGATNASMAPLDKCCTDRVAGCQGYFCTGFDALTNSPFSGSSSSPAPSPTDSGTPTGSGKANAAGKKGYSMLFLGILVLSLAAVHGGV